MYRPNSENCTNDNDNNGRDRNNNPKRVGQRAYVHLQYSMVPLRSHVEWLRGRGTTGLEPTPVLGDAAKNLTAETRHPGAHSRREFKIFSRNRRPPRWSVKADMTKHWYWKRFRSAHTQCERFSLTCQRQTFLCSHWSCSAASVAASRPLKLMFEASEDSEPHVDSHGWRILEIHPLSPPGMETRGK